MEEKYTENQFPKLSKEEAVLNNTNKSYMCEKCKDKGGWDVVKRKGEKIYNKFHDNYIKLDHDYEFWQSCSCESIKYFV